LTSWYIVYRDPYRYWCRVVIGMVAGELAETTVKMIFIDDYGEGYWDPVIELLESETETIEGAVEAVRKKIL